MSHRQQDYKSRGRGGVFPRLGLPVRSDSYSYYRGRGRGGGRGGGGVSTAINQRGRGGGDRGRRGGYRQQGAPSHQRTVVSAPAAQKSWFKVVVVRGADYGKQFVLRALGSYLDRPIWPVLYKTTEDGSATFLIDDEDVADSIGAASRRVQAPNGQKMTIRVNPAPAPFVPLNASDEALITSALQRRYDPINNHLDLSAFNFDSAFKDHPGSNLSLQRNNVMMTVVDLIGKERAIAESIRSIDASQNRIRFLDYFSCIVPRLPNVTRLILHHNQVENIAELEKLAAWNLTELDVDQTPLSGKYRETTAYANDIRRVFKKLTRLDGSDMPPATKFGLDHDEPVAGTSSLPPFKPSFFVDDNVKGLTLKFLELYYTIFDDEDRSKRQSLLEAYDDDATFTMSAMNLSAEGHAKRGETWQELTRDSHNILKMDLWEKFRSKLVHRGKLAILSYLCNNFPPTTHIADTFVMDISFASGNVLCVNASGAFHERSASGTSFAEVPLRFFNRVFLLVQNEKGLRIMNEMLFVSALTSDQYETFAQQVERSAASAAEPAPVTAPMAAAAAVISTAGPSAALVPNAVRADLMIRFASESGMKAEWAQKCLDDYDYDYQKAAAAFAQLKQAGAIPPEAFQ